MPVITLDQIELAYGHVPLLDRVDFSIDAGERVGLIGRNGTGKSSLLRVVAGVRQADAGSIARASGLVTALVEQEPLLAEGATVFAVIAEGLSAGANALVAYEAAVRRAADGGAAALEELGRAQAALEANDGWTLHNRIEATLDRFHLEPDRIVDRLSGGQKKRVALARALVAEPDLLLLDEPTNHLDFDSIRWLETLLRASRGALLFVTHDRAFLNAVATRIVELDRGTLRSYPGNYADYERRKAAELEAEATEHARFDKLLALEEVWVRKGIEARRTRNEGRVRRLEALRAAREARRTRVGAVRLKVDAGERSGRLVAELSAVSKSFGEQPVVRDLSVVIMRGDKVGLIGPNGAGKTTLLNLILGRLEPDQGQVRIGTGLEVAFFDQMREQLDLERSLAETISPGSEFVEVAGQRKHVMSYLGDFLFSPERARSPVKSLSGGERNRLLLARLFARPANLLVLDEPTNDLDIDTLELLEALLEDYPGTVLLVSHDRVFLDNVVTSTLAFEGDGRWRESVGGYEDYERAAQRSRAASPTEAPRPAPAAHGAQAASLTPMKTRKLSYKEQRELEALPGVIEALEREQADIQARLSDPARFSMGAVEIAHSRERDARLEVELLAALARWEELESRNSPA